MSDVNKQGRVARGDIHRKTRGEEDPLDGLVGGVAGHTTIFKNRDALRSDYLPKNLPHRSDHMRRLGEVLLSSLRMIRPSNVFVYGKTGTGKTAVVKRVFERLEEEAARAGLATRYVYVNCRLIGTEYRALAALAEAVGLSVPFTGLATAEVLNRFRSRLLQQRFLVVACFDEIDTLVKESGDDLLYELTRINEGSQDGKISIVGVSNDLLFKDLLDPRVLSSLGEEEVVFHPYTAIELTDILSDRAAEAFMDEAVRAEAVGLCAAVAASEHGDARRALDLLRVSGEVAERAGLAFVGEEQVRVAQGLVERGRVFEALSSLPLHSKIVLLSVLLSRTRLNGDDLTSGYVYSVYRELCEAVGTSHLTERRVSSLISELDMLGVLRCELVSFGRYGRTRKIYVRVPVEEIESVFTRDEFLSGFLPHAVKWSEDARKRGPPS